LARRAIIQAHARAVGVEDADDVGINAVRAVIGHGHGFGEAFGFVIDAADADRVDVAPVFLALRMALRVAVYFAGGGEEEPGVLRLGEAERLWVPSEPTLSVAIGCRR